MIDVALLLLAIEDFFPVALSAAALLAIARLCRSLSMRAGTWSYAGLTLIAVGGATKPVYKTMLALSGGSIDISILDEMLFWFLAPGFLLVAAGAAQAHAAEQRETTATGWVPLGAAVLVGVAAMLVLIDSHAWFYLLLAATTASNVWAVVVLMQWSNARRRKLASVLFLASLLIALGLAGAAATLEQTIPVQWGEQLASTAGQGVFLLGALRLVSPAKP
jgi:hypothetical protein